MLADGLVEMSEVPAGSMPPLPEGLAERFDSKNAGQSDGAKLGTKQELLDSLSCRSPSKRRSRRAIIRR